MSTQADAGGREELAKAAWLDLRAVVVGNERRKQACAELGLSFLRIKALLALRAGPLTQRELGAELGIDRSYTTGISEDLAERGLLTRSVAATDRRCRLLTLTGEGHRDAARARALLETPPPGLVSLDPAELTALAALARRLAHPAPPASATQQ